MTRKKYYLKTKDNVIGEFVAYMFLQEIKVKNKVKKLNKSIIIGVYKNDTMWFVENEDLCLVGFGTG